MLACNTAAGASRARKPVGAGARIFYGGRAGRYWCRTGPSIRRRVAITTGAFEAQSTDPTIGRDEACALDSALIGPWPAPTPHPAVWAPFIWGDGKSPVIDCCEGIKKTNIK